MVVNPVTTKAKKQHSPVEANDRFATDARTLGRNQRSHAFHTGVRENAAEDARSRRQRKTFDD
jgi:hypothetical protein